MSFALSFLIACQTLLSHPAQQVTLQNVSWKVTINPSTLEATCSAAGEAAIPLSEAVMRDASATLQEVNDIQARWQIASKDIEVAAQLEGQTLQVLFRSMRTGDLAWPVIEQTPGCAGVILPTFEGIYLDVDNRPHIDFLANNGPLNTTADLTMPFWGIDYGNRTLTYILTNPFNNTLGITNHGGRIGLRLVHTFTSNRTVKEYGVRVCLGGASPVEPARQYRRYLLDQKQIVTLREKIDRVPDVAKLLGAPHVYLWGNGFLSRHDVTDWKTLARKIRQEADIAEPTVGRRIRQLLSKDQQAMLDKLPSMEWVDEYTKRTLADAFNQLLERPDFLPSLDGVPATQPAELALIQSNCRRLHEAFPDCLRRVDTWGDGVSAKMVRLFSDNGLDRLWLGVDGWKGLRDHPEFVQEAKAKGYLVGFYDSYHSIHAPDEPDTWETAQFDKALYEKGAVVLADGTKKRGFKQKGYVLSPIAARPYVEKRVTERMREISPNSIFIDCDAFGEVFDDYSPDHPATQEQDTQARLDRMAWIRDTFRLVVGSEGGSAYAAPVIHFAHGMMTPVIGWGDPDLTNRTSPYDLGPYFPPDGPAVFFKSSKPKELYTHLYFNPCSRLPLYEIVFHDSVVATHQWLCGSLKFKDLETTRALLELLYGVPPLYHMNVGEFAVRKTWLKSHYAFFSPLHREIGILPMTTFEWLTPDRRVQRTVFGQQVELVANFSDRPYEYRSSSVPSLGLIARWMESGRIAVYAPPTTAPRVDLYRIALPAGQGEVAQASGVHYGKLAEREGLWLISDRNGGDSVQQVFLVDKESLSQAAAGGILKVSEAFRITSPGEGWDAFRMRHARVPAAKMDTLIRQIEWKPGDKDHPLDLEGITIGKPLSGGESHLFVIAEQPDNMVLELSLRREGAKQVARLVGCYAYNEDAAEHGTEINDGLEGIAWAGRPGEFYLAEEGTSPHRSDNAMLYFNHPRLMRCTLKDGLVQIDGAWSGQVTESLRSQQKGTTHTLNALSLVDDRTLVAVDRNAGVVYSINVETRNVKPTLDFYASNGLNLRQRLADFPAGRKMPYVSIEGITLDPAGNIWLADDPAIPEDFRVSSLVRIRGGATHVK